MLGGCLRGSAGHGAGGRGVSAPRSLRPRDLGLLDNVDPAAKADDVPKTGDDEPYGGDAEDEDEDGAEVDEKDDKLIEDASDLGENDDDMSEVKEHIDDGVEDKN